MTSHRSGALWGLVIAMLGGCASVDVQYPDGHRTRMSRAEFKAYAERVFRYQNRIVDRLIRADGAYGDEQGEPDARLSRAEEAMEEACRPLISLVSAKAEHRALGLSDKLEMPCAAPVCEHAVAAVDVLLSVVLRR